MNKLIRSLHDTQIMLKTLIATSTLMFISLFTIPKMAAIGLLVWVLNVGWSMALIFKSNNTGISDVFEANENKAKAFKENGNYAMYGVQMIALPLCAVGLIMVVLIIGTMFFM